MYWFPSGNLEGTRQTPLLGTTPLDDEPVQLRASAKTAADEDEEPSDLEVTEVKSAPSRKAPVETEAPAEGEAPAEAETPAEAEKRLLLLNRLWTRRRGSAVRRRQQLTKERSASGNAKRPGELTRKRRLRAQWAWKWRRKLWLPTMRAATERGEGLRLQLSTLRRGVPSGRRRKACREACSEQREAPRKA